MGKNTTTENVKDIKENLDEAVDSATKAKEAIDSLKVQLDEHLKQADYHKTMATKAQGALEVLLQLHPQKEDKN